MEKTTLSIIHRLHNIIQMTVHCFAYSQKHIRCNIVSLAQPFGLRLLWPLLTSHNSLLLQLMEPPVRSHGINFRFFLVYLLIYAGGLRLSLGLRCLEPAHLPTTPHIRFLFVRIRFRYPFFSPTSHDANLGNRHGLSAATPLVEFHHKLTTCPSYRQKRRAFRLAAFGIMISDRFLPLSYASSAIYQALRPARVLRHRAWTVSFPSKC